MPNLIVVSQMVRAYNVWRSA